jgi:hypothetical protein
MRETFEYTRLLTDMSVTIIAATPPCPFSETNSTLAAGWSPQVVYGVDEAGLDVQRVADDVTQLATRFPRSRVVVTSRPNALEGIAFPGEPFTVAGLDDPAIGALLRAWCELYEMQRVGPAGATAGRAEGARLADEVLASPQLRELAQSPLLATIIAIVHRAGVRLPDHRVELHDHIVRILVERWNQLRSRERGVLAPTIRTADAIRLLGPVAFEMVKHRSDGAIDEASLRDLLATQLTRGTVRVFTDVDQAITVFRNSLGLLVEQAPGVYSFLHKTHAEFLAAHEAARTGALETILDSEERFSPAWREVILLALGVVGTLHVDDERLQSAIATVVAGARRGNRSRGGAQERRSRLVVQCRVNRRAQVVEDVALLLAAGVDHALEVGGEDVAAGALAAEARLAPRDESAQLALRVVVRRLDRRIVDEAPHRVAVLEDVLARAADPSEGQIAAFFEETFDVRSDDDRCSLKSRAGTGAIADAMMNVEQQAGPEQQGLTDLASASIALPSVPT